MAKELACEQGVRNTATVLRDERHLFAGTIKVNGTGDKFFPCSCLTFNEDCYVGVNNPLAQSENLQHPLAVPYDLIKTIVPFNLSAQVGHLVLGFLDNLIFIFVYKLKLSIGTVKFSAHPRII